jgi:hypothetical protein
MVGKCIFEDFIFWKSLSLLNPNLIYQCVRIVLFELRTIFKLATTQKKIDFFPDMLVLLIE